MSYIRDEPGFRFEFEDKVVRDLFINEYIDDTFYNISEHDEEDKEWINTKAFKSLKNAFIGACYEALTSNQNLREIIQEYINEDKEVFNACSYIVSKYYFIEER